MQASHATQSKPQLRWLLFPWLVVILVWISSGIWLHDDIDRGTFGDMFGAVNALFSGLAFATLIYTSWMQREELALQREELSATRTELEGQKLQLAEQTATFALQRFEDSFFSLLRTHGEIVNAMDLVDGNGRTTRSRDCFKVWYQRLEKMHAGMGVRPGDQGLQTMQAAYRQFYTKHQGELGHYFRHLYHVLKFIKEASIKDKQKYTSLVRAQLSGYEHLMLFYNCISEYGYAKFKPIVEEFALLENMPKDQLISRSLHVGFYAPSAYGEDGAA